MQKLSRTEKYKEYRNKLNNDGEREIATKELRELQEKIIFNEKRFGNSSRTESDLNRGRRDTSLDDYYNSNNNSIQNQHDDDLKDIFTELNRYKRYPTDINSNSNENHDDYIKKIKDIIKKANPREESNVENITEENNNNSAEIEKIIFKKDNIVPNEPINEEQSSINNKSNDEILINVEKQTIVEEQTNITEQLNFDEKPNQVNIQKNESNYFSQKQNNDNFAEFVEEKNIELPKSQLENITIKKADIKPTIPQYDHSKEFEEICMNVNSLAEKIESSNSFGKDQYVPPASSHRLENSFEAIQQNVKKELIGNDKDNNIFDELEKELHQFNEDTKKKDNVSEEKKNNIVKSEVSEQMKEEFDNTVSLQVDKLMGEINSSKSDNISAADIIKDNDMAKKAINDHPGKTIAFEMNKNNEVPDNTIVLSDPPIDDSSIHTMSFKTEDLDIEDGEKGNAFLNVILCILIVIAFGALAVIIYFFLITRGII